MRKHVLPAVLTAFAALFLSACAEEGTKDPYTTVSLRDVSRGMVVSKQFKYKFVNPEIVVLHRNLGIIREGNVMEFIAARSLEDKLEDATGGYFELDVVKRYSPFVHFKVEKIATETDTIFPPQTGGIAYPTITTPEKYGVGSFEEYDINTVPYNRTGTLRELVGRKIKIRAPITVEQEEGKDHFIIHGKDAKFRIADPPDGTGLILKILAQKGYVFEGGLLMTEVEGYANRMRTRMAGTVDVQWVMYGQQLISG